MSKQQEPKKPRAKSKKLNLSSRNQWEQLLKEVYKEQVPVNVLKFLTVNLKDGTTVEINIEEMLASGLDPEYVENLLNTKLAALDSIIEDVDFHVDVDSVAKTVQPHTDDLLKGL